MKIRNTTGIKSICSADTLAAYLRRVSHYIETATADIADISDATVMSDALDDRTLQCIRDAVDTCHKLTAALSAAVSPLDSLLSSLRARPYDDDPRRPQLYKMASKAASDAHSVAQSHINAISTLRDIARAHASLSYSAGAISSAAMVAIARADNAHSHVLMACQAARQLLIDRRELQPYRPKL